jgi:hypothetical protein
MEDPEVGVHWVGAEGGRGVRERKGWDGMEVTGE